MFRIIGMESNLRFPELDEANKYLSDKTTRIRKISDPAFLDIASWQPDQMNGTTERDVARWLLSGKEGCIPTTVRVVCDSGPIIQTGTFRKRIKGVPLSKANEELRSKIPAYQVHRLFIDDLRFNMTSRNEKNLIVEDNGNIWAVSNSDTWHRKELSDLTVMLSLPQCKEPFSTETLEYINSLDAKKDKITLKKNQIRLVKHLHKYHALSIAIIQLAAKKKMTLYQIGKMFLDIHQVIRQRPVVNSVEIVNQWHSKNISGIPKIAYLPFFGLSLTILFGKFYRDGNRTY